MSTTQNQNEIILTKFQLPSIFRGLNFVLFRFNMAHLETLINTHFPSKVLTERARVLNFTARLISTLRIFEEEKITT